MPRTKSPKTQMSAVPKKIKLVTYVKGTKFSKLTPQSFVECEAPNWTQKAARLGYDSRDSSKLRHYVMKQDWYEDYMNPELTKKKVIGDLTFETYSRHAGLYSLKELTEKLGFKQSRSSDLSKFIRKQGWDKIIKPTLRRRSARIAATASVSTEPTMDTEGQETIDEEELISDDLPVDLPMCPVDSWGLKEVAMTKEPPSDETETDQDSNESSSDGTMTTQEPDEPSSDETTDIDNFFLP